MFGGYLGQIRAQFNIDNQSEQDNPSYLSASKRYIKFKTTDDNGLTKTSRYQLGIVQPSYSGMPEKHEVQIYEYINSPSLLFKTLRQLSGPMAVDIETNGTQAADYGTRIVGIGMATLNKIVYFDFETNVTEANQAVLDFLANYKDPLIGHNIFFDGTYLLRETGKWLNWKYDTYGLYRQLSNEGHTGQTYGLKSAQVQLLNWPEKGDVELGEWLVRNEYYTDVKKTAQDNYYRGKDIKDEPRYYKPNKAMMYKAPAQILGYYCGLDAASTLLLYTDVFMPSINGQPWEQEFRDYHDLFIKNVELLANQQLTGITIDKDMLTKYKSELEQEIIDDTNQFLNIPEVKQLVDILRQEQKDEMLANQPERYKKIKYPKEPAQFKKNGEESAAWLNWKAKMIDIEQTGPEQSKVWENWKARFDSLDTTCPLNLNSNPQLARLFYDHLKFPVKTTTNTGEASVGTNALPGFGPIGKQLESIREKEKELGYVVGCLEHLIQGADGYWRLHPQFRAPGTLTCRLAGSGGVNLQQIPKSRRYLECWKPRPGKAWVDCDHSALEQVVMAELTQDKNMLKIYGPDAKPNDIYLFNAALMAKQFNIKLFQPILDAGYDPDNPTPEGIANAKKQCKHLRGISKVATLGKSYGMGGAKFQANMALQGVDLTWEEAIAVAGGSRIQGRFDSEYVTGGLDLIYSEVRQYTYHLKKQIKDNDGYVLNGIGRPVCCAKDYLKDIVNRVVQSTGHDIHMMYIKICHELLDNEHIEHDGIVWDFHDQTILECNSEDAERVKYLIGTKAYEVLNEQLGGVIKLKGDPQIINNLADAKCEA